MDNEKESLTALAIAVMTKTAERIGNSLSAESGHYGVVFFKKSHIKIEQNTVYVSYVAKSGVFQEKQFTDELIALALKMAIKNSPDKYVFTTSSGYKLQPENINRYLSEYGITGKDIRGFMANDFMVKGLSKINPDELKDADGKKRLKLFNKVAKAVAERVGHGRPTLKKHYLLPELEESFIKDGTVINLSEFYSGGEVERDK